MATRMAYPEVTPPGETKLQDEKMLDDKRSLSSDEVQPTVESGKLTSWEGVPFTTHDANRAARKVDMILISTLTMYYFLSFLDRGNIGNARVAGMLTTLNMTLNDYNICLSVLFVPYILIELPMTLILKRVGPNYILPTLVCLWGCVTLAQGFVTSFGQLLACRFLLGLLEGGLTPCSVLVMTSYIRRYGLQRRTAFFFGTITLAGAFSGLIAYGITKNLDGSGGRAGWEWIFIIEGAITAVLALVGYITIPRAPSMAWWLKPAEKAALLAYMAEDGSAYVDHREEKVNIWHAVSVMDPRQNQIVPAVTFLNICAGFIVFALSYYVPPIVAGLGWSTVQAQLMTVPPNAVGFLLAVIMAFVGDHIRSRGIIASGCGVSAMIGFLIQLTASAPLTRYGALFFQLAAQGVLSPALSAWGMNNSGSHLRRAAFAGIAFGGTNVIGLASVWSFKPNESPRYPTGTGLGLATAIIFATFPWFVMWNARRLNRKREAELANLPAGHKFDSTIFDDRDVRFRYTY